MIVKGEGDVQSKIWLIGEAPGAHEERTGRPFVGGAGTVLNGILQQAGIKRDECFIDNVMQKRPPKNDFGAFYEDKGKWKPTPELAEGHRRVKEAIALHRPNVVVALGNEALFALTGHKGIMKWRGSILGCHGIKVIPSVHPAMIMRQYEYRPVAIMDFNRIKREAETPHFPPAPDDNFILNPTFDTVMKQIKLLHEKEYIAFDIETAQNQIVCMGFAWNTCSSICIPIFFAGSSWWTAEEEFAIIKAMKELFANPSIKFIAQNAQFDMTYIADKWGIKVANLWMDTMVAFHCVYPELRKGLAFLCSIYTDRQYYKGMAHEGEGPAVLWKYNCLDTVVTFECAMAIRKELKEFGTFEFYQNHSHKLIMPLMEMQRRGVKIDLTKRRKIDESLTKDWEDMQARLTKAAGRELNPNSPKQMKEFLYTDMKLPPQRSKTTGNLTADADAVKDLAKKFPSPVLALILDIRKVRKILSTYIRAPLDNDGRIRCSYVITGTETGRLSSRESVYGSGTNLQNIPRGELVRSIFIPDTAKKFVHADLSQAEARVVAYLSGERRLQALFERDDGDIHRHNAARVFNKTLDMVTDDERQLAKALVHAANYGIGARTFGKHIGSTESRARELLNQYFALYPCIKTWHMDVESRLRNARILTTPFGRRRMFFGRWGPDLVREAYAYVPQSTVSDLLNWGIIRAWPRLPHGWEIMMQVHDSVLIQLPKETDPMHIYKFIKHYFENPLEINHVRFKIPIDIKIGENWGSMKPMEVK